MSETRMGRILKIDLTSGSIEVQTLSEDILRNFIGGRGLGTYLLGGMLDSVPAPLSPENPLIFATGPLTGTPAPTGGRYMVLCRSPLTGLLACSNSGGSFGAELRKAGWDAVVFQGKSEHPVYVHITGDGAEIRSAERLWGMDTHETTDAIRQEFDDSRMKIACIGPAGENMVRFACIINEKSRAAGRSGVGAVMGSKNLKAVVTRAVGQVDVPDADRFMGIIRQKMEILKNDGVTGEALPALGTKVLDNIINGIGAYPTRNFQKGQFEGISEVTGEALGAKGYLKKNKACYSCPIRCGRVTEVPTGNKGEGPEYESGWAMGACMGINDLSAITEANYLCNRLGMDTISCGVTLAWAMELYEKGLIEKEELEGGPEPRFGSTESLVFYTRAIGMGQGFGARLGQGSARLARHYGAPELSMSVKGQELPAYDPRGVQGQALAYATSNRGGCHVRAYLIAPEVLGVPEKLDPQVTEGKAEWVKIFQDLTAVIDSSGLCLFSSFALGAEDYRDLLEAGTGFDYSLEEMMKCGERIWNLERLLNLRLGMDPADDTLPARMLEEQMPEGPQKGKVARLREMLPEYYFLRGWDSRGIPMENTLADLGLA